MQSGIQASHALRLEPELVAFQNTHLETFCVRGEFPFSRNEGIEREREQGETLPGYPNSIVVQGKY